MDIVIPSLSDDPTVAPPGKHVDVVLRAVRARTRSPTAPSGTTRGGTRSATPSSTRWPSTCRTSASHVLHRQVLTPLDLEREFGLSEGNIFHGELTPGSAVLHAPRARLGAPRDPDPPPLPLRLVGPPRRRHHGRPRPQRRPRHPPRPALALPIGLPMPLPICLPSIPREPDRNVAVSSTLGTGRRSNSSTDRRRSRRHAHRCIRVSRLRRPGGRRRAAAGARRALPRRPVRRRSTTPRSSTSSIARRSAPAPRTWRASASIGLDRYLDEQLHPERLSDAEVRARLAGFETLALDSSRDRRALLRAAAARAPRRPGRTPPAIRRPPPTPSRPARARSLDPAERAASARAAPRPAAS